MVVQVGVGVARRAEVSRVLIIARLAVTVAFDADAFVFDRDVPRALLEALVAEVEAEGQGLIAAGASGQAARASLAWRAAELTGLSLVDPMVSCRTLIHALVAEQVHAEMTLNALQACLVALEATSIAL